MNNLEHSIIRSRELKENKIKLSDVNIFTDILVKSDMLVHIRDGEENIVNNTEIKPELLLEGLKNDKTDDVDLANSELELKYAENKNIINKNYRENYDYFRTTPYVEVDVDNDEFSIAPIEINDALIIETDNILLDEPLVLNNENVSNVEETKQEIESADDIYVYAENEKLKLELHKNETYGFSDAFKGEGINIIIFILFTLSFIQTSIAITFLLMIGILSLYTDEFMKIYNGKTIKNRYFVDYGFDKSCKMSNVFDTNKEKTYEVDISEQESNILIKSNKLDAEWNIDNKGILSDKFVTLFENIGFENITNNSLQLKITPAYKIYNKENYLISECGLWCIDTKQYITQKNKTSQKIMQHN